MKRNNETNRIDKEEQKQNSSDHRRQFPQLFKELKSLITQTTENSLRNEGERYFPTAKFSWTISSNTLTSSVSYLHAEGFDPSHLISCSSLKILNLHGALSHFRSNADQRLALGSLNLSIQSSGCGLRELNLSQNAVGHAILEIKDIVKKIEILNLSDIGLNADTGNELFQILNPQILDLNLSQNNLGNSVLSLNNFSCLEVLDISSNRIPSDVLDKFLMNFNCITFKEINLSDNGFLEKFQDGWINFCTALSYMEDLSILRVGSIGLTHMQIELLLEVLSKKTVPIVFLDISYSALNEHLAPLLIKALQNTPITGLCLDGIKYLPEVAKFLKTRVDIKVEWDRSGDKKTQSRIRE